MLRGNHYWRFEAATKRGDWTNFVHNEEFSGALAILFSDWSPGGYWLRNRFDKFNQDLKKRVETIQKGSDSPLES